MTEELARIKAENATLRTALREAAQSLRTIADQSGKDEFLKDIDQIRGYANSRANVAEAH